MAKTPTKASSWRTLARRAEKATSPTVARRLRAEAARLRRADRATKGVKKKSAPAGRNIDAGMRAAKGWATRRADELRKAVGAGGLAALAAQAPAAPQGINRDVSSTWNNGKAPGHGEIVGGADSQLAEKLVALARKKGGKDAVQIELMTLRQASKYEGCVETDKASTTRLIEVQQITADRVVCGFIAEVDHAMQFHRGLPPAMTWLLNSFTVTKIVDALNKAGYRATGKT